MKRQSMRRYPGLVVLVMSSLAWLTPLEAGAAPIQLVNGTVNMFRDTRGANNIGIGQGDVMQYGASIVGGSLGTTLGASYPPTGFTDPQTPCAPLAVNANFCANATPYVINRTAQPWTLRFERPNEAPVLIGGPSLAGTEVAIPFPVNVTISGSGLSPTISWTIPNNFVADAVRINIFDRNVRLPNGQADQTHVAQVDPSTGSYTIPAVLSSGQTLAFGGDYVFNVQLIDTRRDPSFFLATGNNAEILRRSSSFFNFTPLDATSPPNVHLPTVVNGVYNFAFEIPGPNSVMFIDPFVAVGYDYAIGEGDPNFASVLLPTGIGDNLFDLFVWNGTDFVDSGINLLGGDQYFFGGLGVDRFSIRGIETSAALDPDNVTAFITGLTFMRAGNFTGTMTPITVEVAAVPEPSTALLFLASALGLAGLCRRTTRSASQR
jgi:PEP-CTERM motif